MARQDMNEPGEVQGGGGRDYFWVKIVVGLVLVTVASLLISKLVVPRISAGLGGKKTEVTSSAGTSANALEETGALVKEHEGESRSKDGYGSGLTEEESGGTISKKEKKAEPEKTGVTIEKVEQQKEEKKSEETLPDAAKTVAKKPEPKSETRTTAQVERTVEKKVEKKAEKEPVKEKPKTETKPAEEKKTVVKAEPSKPATTVKKEEKKEPEKPKTPEKTQTAPAKDNTVYVLQLGNFTSRENAEKMKKMLVDQYKIDVYIKQNDYQGQTRYRVQAGAFKDRANAEKFAGELQEKGYNSYIAETTIGK